MTATEAPSSRDFPLVVYGATGYTGRLLCEKLHQGGTSFALAGRNQARLEALRQELGLKDTQIIEAPLSDATALRKMAASARVVLSCAGPFAQYGKPVQDAALSARSHFLDITGEYAYMLETHRRDPEARAAGVVLVNAVGFDVVPTDTAAVLACEALSGKPVMRVRIAFTFSGTPSRGTMRTMLQGGPKGLSYSDGQWVEEPIGQHLWEAPLPPPVGRHMTISVPWGDVATAPRSTGARSVQVFVTVPPALLPFIRLGGPLLRTLSPGWVRDLLSRALDLLPDGPSALMRSQGRTAVCAEAASADGEHQVAWVTAGDPYAFTAASAALCARLAAADGYDKSGALTPTQAFGARTLLEGLKGEGVEWGSG